MNKKLTIICFLTFLIGCAGGGTLAYANHQKGLEAQSLLASISQTQNDWEVEQFIREQEEQRPDGLEESQIATGSRYTGITYNNVSVASANDTSKIVNHDNQDEKSGLLGGLFQATDKDADGVNQNTSAVEQEQMSAVASHAEKMTGRVAIQSGSLNIRAIGSIDGDVIGQAYKDELVEIIAQDGRWYQIVTANGLEGYVSSTYIEVVK